MTEGVSDCSVADVLVIDDQKRIGRLLERILTPQMAVEIRTRGREAMDVVDERQFDAILCDLYMPDLSGREFFEWLRDEMPEMADRVVFVTGGAPDERGRKFLADVDNPLVYKPFDFDELREVLAEITGRDFDL